MAKRIYKTNDRREDRRAEPGQTVDVQGDIKLTKDGAHLVFRYKGWRLGIPGVDHIPVCYAAYDHLTLAIAYAIPGALMLWEAHHNRWRSRPRPEYEEERMALCCA